MTSENYGSDEAMVHRMTKVDLNSAAVSMPELVLDEQVVKFFFMMNIVSLSSLSV